MASGNASAVCISVIDDVVSKVRKDFITYGVGDSVLNELQALWEMKLLHRGAISGNIDRNRAPPAGASAGGATPPVHDLNVPYKATSEEYATPTADMLFPPTPLQTPIQTPLPAGIDTAGMYDIPTGPWDYAPSPIADMRNGMGMMNGADPQTGRPSPFMQPPSPWMNQRPLGLDVNLAFAYEDPDRMMQQTTKEFLMTSCGKRKRDEYPSGSFVPQQDGCADQVAVHYDATPDYNTTGESSEYQTPTPAVATPKPGNDTAGGDDDDDEPPLNEDDDDDDDDTDDFVDTQHLVLAQFDKITRTKNRWKCTLKNGIMHLNGRDVLFNKASGEFDF